MRAGTLVRMRRVGSLVLWWMRMVGMLVLRLWVDSV